MIEIQVNPPNVLRQNKQKKPYLGQSNRPLQCLGHTPSIILDSSNQEIFLETLIWKKYITDLWVILLTKAGPRPLKHRTPPPDFGVSFAAVLGSQQDWPELTRRTQCQQRKSRRKLNNTKKIVKLLHKRNQQFSKKNCERYELGCQFISRWS